MASYEAYRKVVADTVDYVGSPVGGVPAREPGLAGAAAAGVGLLQPLAGAEGAVTAVPVRDSSS